MTTKVMKFGGSSLATCERIRAAAGLVAEEARKGVSIAVVVSAMGKTTEGLLGLAGEVSCTSDRRELDQLLASGEQQSAALFSLALKDMGVAARSYTGAQAGIRVKGMSMDGRISSIDPSGIIEGFGRGESAIVAGFQGLGDRGEILTLGRGGSDLTAVALAAALKADDCLIFTDVDGVYSADPRVVPEARHIPEMDHEMLQEMAESGAKVLNAQAVEWARRAGIAVYARASFGPVDAHGEPERQTVIRKFAPGEGSRVRAVVGEGQAAFVRMHGTRPADMRRAWELLREQQIPMRELSIGERGTAFGVPLANVPDWTRARTLMETDPAFHGSHVDTDMAVLSVVGAGLTDTPEPLIRMMDALAGAGIEPVEVRGSPLRLRAIVAQDRAADGQRALHARFTSD